MKTKKEGRIKTYFNIEAQAAQVYWPALFGSNFRRDRSREDLNILLNYGYAVIRSSMTNAVLSAGLHPTFGVFHRNRNNPLCLVDDLIEPYRPIVDQVVRSLDTKGCRELTSDTKRCLASIVTGDQVVLGKTSPLFQHMYGLSYALLKCIGDGKVSALPMPKLFTELEVEAMVLRC